ncbi:MAG: ATP-binding protein [Sphaerochaeta sp.]|jgi:tRNA 2-thiocytidine biosynthesis protein TtcA|nr:adenine nucleotide alpha hydrolase [Spirochaetales bacterium]
MQNPPWKRLIEGPIPSNVMRFAKQTGKAINTYSMIGEGETVLLSASGGKDSLALALALSLRRRWLPIDYTLKAVLINWLEHPIAQEGLELLEEYFTALGYELTIYHERQNPDSFNGDFNCYLCSRNRRRIIFEHCRKEGIELVAMGHHLDDLVETTLMNLCFRASFSTMLPVQPFFDGKVTVIRPMIEVREKNIASLAKQLELPVIKPVCPYDQSNIRSRLKPIVSSLSHLDPLTRQHIYNSHHFEGRV